MACGVCKRPLKSEELKAVPDKQKVTKEFGSQKLAILVIFNNLCNRGH